MRLASRSLAPLTLVITVAVFAGAGPKSKTVLPPLNQKVLDFAREQLGKKVGDGECTSFAIEALGAAGARRLPLSRRDGDYVWGREVEAFRDALPGDVLQFRDAVLHGKRSLSRRRWISWHHEYPHHTAIVSEVKEGGRVVSVLHQNVGGRNKTEAEKQRVQELTLRVDSLQEGGRIWIYRPISPHETEPQPLPRDDGTQQ